jgi:Leucine-rich repeat (LRR) protein
VLRKTTLILKVRIDFGSALHSLSYFFFQNNQLLSLKGGGSFSDLVLLETLDISNNKLDTLPEELKHLCNLKASI